MLDVNPEIAEQIKKADSSIPKDYADLLDGQAVIVPQVLPLPSLIRETIDFFPKQWIELSDKILIHDEDVVEYIFQFTVHIH